MRAVDEVADQTRYDGDGVVKCDRALESMLTPEPTACRIDHMTRFWWATAFSSTSGASRTRAVQRTSGRR